jgi:predicted DNA-binding transcriptional regulator AlpA
MANKQDKIKTPADLIIKDHYLLKTVEVLKILNISRTTFDKIKNSTSFPKAVTKLGARPLWIKQEVIEWLTQNAR